MTQSTYKSTTASQKIRRDICYLFNTFSLPEFAGRYMTDLEPRYISHVKDVMAENAASGKGFWDVQPTFGIFSDYAPPPREAQKEKIRYRDIRPFTREETQALRKKHAQYPHIGMTMMLMDRLIADYFNDLFISLNYDHIDRYSTHIQKADLRQNIQNALQKNSFYNEFLPHILISANDDDKNILTERTAQAGLKTAFERSALRSKRYAASQRGSKPVSICPFGDVIAPLWSAEMTLGTDGAIIPTGEKRKGAFPAFLSQRVAEIAATPA